MEERLRGLEAELKQVCAERDRLSEKVRVLEAQHDALASAPIGIMTVSGHSGSYLFANEAYAKLLGKTQKELFGGDAYEIWLKATAPEQMVVERALVEQVARGEVDRFEVDKQLLRADGSSRWVHATFVASRGDNRRLESLTGYFVDIQEQRTADLARERLEAQVRQSQKLEALGKLAGGVAHDFNNRLVIILSYTEFLRRGLPLDSPLVDHAEAVLASAQRASELTRQLLAYCRRQVLEPEAFDLNESVEGMRRLLERLIGDSIELSTTLGAEHPIFSDRGQIEQVILNLAINSRDAMAQGGRLTLETSDRTLGADEDATLPPGDYVALQVRDTGTGIAESDLPRIFEPFFSTKEVGQGTGLGLSMVEGIVRQSGGTVSVATVVGQGTTFTILLPRARASAVPVRRSEEAAPQRDIPFETVLVCEDDDGIRKLLVDVLSLRGYHLLQAKNGRHALEVVREHQGPIHLLVTDLVMPELGGIALATELRKQHPALLVLYVSGYSDSPDPFAELGPATRFLAKPFLPGDITRAVFSLLEDRRHQGAAQDPPA